MRTFWEISSVGSERLPYKQRVGGSNPSSPTNFKGWPRRSSFFYCSYSKTIKKGRVNKPPCINNEILLRTSYPCFWTTDVWNINVVVPWHLEL